MRSNVFFISIFLIFCKGTNTTLPVEKTGGCDTLQKHPNKRDHSREVGSGYCV